MQRRQCIVLQVPPCLLPTISFLEKLFDLKLDREGKLEDQLGNLTIIYWKYKNQVPIIEEKYHITWTVFTRFKISKHWQGFLTSFFLDPWTIQNFLFNYFLPAKKIGTLKKYCT